jgi:hypothetical protein
VPTGVPRYSSHWQASAGYLNPRRVYRRTAWIAVRSKLLTGKKNLMQQSSPSSATGELIRTFRHGKGFVIFTLVFGIVMLCLAGFLLYLSTKLPVDASAPVSVNSSRGMRLDFSSPQTMIYAVSAFLALLAFVMFGIHVWQKKLRQTSYEVYEHGIAHMAGAHKDYVPFTAIEDLYLFSSGQAAFTGLITNLAFRRKADEPFHRVIESLKGFHDFQQRVRELHVRERLPLVLSTLQSGGAVTFRYVTNGQVWSKRATGNALNIKTESIIVTANFIEVQGRKVPMSTLRTVDLSAWTERVVIKDENGQEVLSTLCTGILSHDLFLNTLDVLLGAEAESRDQAEPVLA